MLMIDYQFIYFDLLAFSWMDWQNFIDRQCVCQPI